VAVGFKLHAQDLMIRKTHPDRTIKDRRSEIGRAKGVRVIKSEPPNDDPTVDASSSLHLIAPVHRTINGIRRAPFLRTRAAAQPKCDGGGCRRAHDSTPSAPKSKIDRCYATRRTRRAQRRTSYRRCGTCRGVDGEAGHGNRRVCGDDGSQHGSTLTQPTW
jgi:hypothetical protein